MASDKRQKTGVLATVSHEGGKVRLVLHDAASQPGGGSWVTRAMYTHVDFDASTFQKSELTERELANIGLSVVTRLSALAKA